jgi:putative transcription factor
MPECEICGSGEAEYMILVEGAKLSVCRDCSVSGKLLRGPPPRTFKEGRGEAASASTELEVAEGYGQIMASARKRLGLPIEVLAEKINEKLSSLERVEREKMRPDQKLCRKLEKELGIKLLIEVAESSTSPVSASKGGMTLGDILEIQQKKKGQK